MLGLTKKQEYIVKQLLPKCQKSCEFLYPIDEDKKNICIQQCSNQNKELFRMENVSFIGVGIAVLLVFIAMFTRLK
jgi:hypothetical protein